MKIVVISDSHGHSDGIDKIFKELTFDYLFFLGDGLKDLGDYIYLDNVYAVSGNCDFFSIEPNEREFEIENSKFFITHGNSYGVKYSLHSIVNEGLNRGVDFVCFGHTHNKYVEEVDGMTILNPGTFKNNSGIIIDIKNNKCEISNLEI